MATHSIETGPAVVHIPGEVRTALPRAGLLAIVGADALSFPALCDVHAAIADAVAATAVAVVGLEVYAERGAIRPGALCQADVANIGFGGDALCVYGRGREISSARTILTECDSS
jgi:hypothetical protein